MRRTCGPFCRLAFRIVDSEWVFGCVAAALTAIRATFGQRVAFRVLDALAARLVWSRWPRYADGWINLYSSRLNARLRRALAREQPLAAPRPVETTGSRVRVGCIGAFAGLLTCPPDFFKRSPPEIELFAYDVQYGGEFAGFVPQHVSGYHAITTDASPAWIDRAAEAINRDRLDILLVVYLKNEAYRLLDRVDTPAVVDICTGCEILHHPRVAFHIYPQPEADFFPRGGRIFCAVTQRAVESARVFPGWVLYDRRDLNPAVAPVLWASRDPQIVFHGSLFKLSGGPFLDLVFRLLQEDNRVSFVFMGSDRSGAVEAISRRAERAGVGPQVEYMGEFKPLRSQDGLVHDPGWEVARRLLARARLAPDPWPVGGASSRFEAYMLGAPCVHMGLRTDEASWNRSQPTLVDVPALEVARGTAHSIEGYASLCRRCLYDGTFADGLISEQRQVALEVSDAEAYWRQLLACYHDWRASVAVH